VQAYSTEFAHVYNLRWTFFADQMAPRILEFYRRAPISATNPLALDLCCGTGQLARHLLENGLRVIGVDSSAGMLQHAAENNAAYVEQGAARFIQADAANFTLGGAQVGLAVSTFDALNHLESDDALRRCFQCVFASVAPGGIFLFDLNTRAGLAGWNGINIDDGEDAMIVTRGIYDAPSRRATVRISGFARRVDGLYERFEETAFNTAFDLAWVRQALLDCGWRSVHFARGLDLATPIDEPEKERRAFVVARA
jgi:SAM-dependent methyltransferase